MRWILLALLAGCGSDDGIYETCEVADDCEDVPEDQDAACLDKGDEGYCTWTCAADEDCAADEEDEDEDDRVCASFESEDDTYCFPSCEEGDDTCPDGMTCRSTGGGSENRKVCFPEE